MAQNGVDIEIGFDKAFSQLNETLAATPAQLERAGQRAIKKTMTWVKTRIARELSESAGITQKHLKTRLTVKNRGSGKDKVTVLWLGVEPMLADKAGKGRQTKKGVSLKQRRYEGAFIRDMYGYDNGIWIRSERNTDNYTTTAKNRKVNPNALPEHLRGRFPVQHIAIDIEEHAAELFKRLQARIPDEFDKKFAQELNYVLNHEKG